MAEQQTVNSRDSGQASWNINSSYAMIISSRLAKSQGYYDIGNFMKYFNILRSIFELTTHNLDDQDLEKMDELVKKVLKYQKYFLKYKKKVDQGSEIPLTEEDVKGKALYVENIRRFQRGLLKVLKMCGFLTNTRKRSHLKL